MRGWPEEMRERGGDRLTEREKESDSAQQCGRERRRKKPQPFLKAHGLQ